MFEATYKTRRAGVNITKTFEVGGIHAGTRFLLENFNEEFDGRISEVDQVRLLAGLPISVSVNVPDMGEFTVEMSVEEIKQPDFLAPDPKNPIYLYILVRDDMASFTGTDDNCKTGLPCAQTGHAANQMVYQVRQKNISSLNDLLTEWENETGMGFGTEIVVSASFAEVKQTVEMASLLGHHAAMMLDPEFPLVDGKTVHYLPIETCGYIFGRKNDLSKIMRRFNLMP
jgi:hypothetical protein